MINLLPPDYKKQLTAARSNSLLVRYNILLASVLVVLALAIGALYGVFITTKTVADQTIADNEAKAAQYQSVAKEATEFRKNLTEARAILDSQVSYSRVMLEIGRTLPDGVVLSSLSLDAATFGTPVTLQAQARDINSAVALKTAFQNSDLFSNVSFSSINEGGADQYNYNVTINVTINKTAAQL